MGRSVRQRKLCVRRQGLVHHAHGRDAIRCASRNEAASLKCEAIWTHSGCGFPWLAELMLILFYGVQLLAAYLQAFKSVSALQ